MNNLPSYREYVSKLNIVYNAPLYENYVESVTLSPHAKMRTIRRDGVEINVPKIEIDRVIYSAEQQIISFSKSYEDFIVYDKRTTLNVVGTIHPITPGNLKKGYDFYVGTLMYNKNYVSIHPKTDKKIVTSTSVSENDEYIIFGIKFLNETKDFNLLKELILNDGFL